MENEVEEQSRNTQKKRNKKEIKSQSRRAKYKVSSQINGESESRVNLHIFHVK